METTVQLERVEPLNEPSLRNITDTLPAYVAYVNDRLVYTMANVMYSRQFGRPTEELIGARVADVLGVSFSGVAPHLLAALAGEPQHFETRMLTQTGERVLRVAHIPDVDGEGGIAGVIVYGYDITEQRRAKEALIRSEKLAAVGRLASSMAHEINNPLEAVVNLLYLAEHSIYSEPAEALGFVQLAQGELARVSQITTQALQFFKQSTAASVADLGTLFESLMVLYKGRLANSGIAIRQNVRPGTRLRCHESELRQVLSNLIGNAIDAMRQGGCLYLRARSATHPQTGREGVRITLADNGHGMDAATIGQIFEPFFTTKGISGTGLGLWVTSNLVRKAQGSLHVRSRKDGDFHGTVFALFLPALMNDETSAA